MSTQKYLVMLRGGTGKQEPPSDRELQDIYAAFHAWQEKFKANIIDMGAKLKPGGKIVTTAGVTDGPFVEAREIIGGFMIVGAESYEQAIEIACGCPGVVRPGSSLEIREMAGP